MPFQSPSLLTRPAMTLYLPQHLAKPGVFFQDLFIQDLFFRISFSGSLFQDLQVLYRVAAG